MFWLRALVNSFSAGKLVSIDEYIKTNQRIKDKASEIQRMLDSNGPIVRAYSIYLEKNYSGNMRHTAADAHTLHAFEIFQKIRDQVGQWRPEDTQKATVELSSESYKVFLMQESIVRLLNNIYLELKLLERNPSSDRIKDSGRRIYAYLDELAKKHNQTEYMATELQMKAQQLLAKLVNNIKAVRIHGPARTTKEGFVLIYSDELTIEELRSINYLLLLKDDGKPAKVIHREEFKYYFHRDGSLGSTPHFNIILERMVKWGNVKIEDPEPFLVDSPKNRELFGKVHAMTLLEIKNAANSRMNIHLVPFERRKWLRKFIDERKVRLDYPDR